MVMAKVFRWGTEPLELLCEVQLDLQGGPHPGTSFVAMLAPSDAHLAAVEGELLFVTETGERYRAMPEAGHSALAGADASFSGKLVLVEP
jgi:hypothetical protein